MRVLLTGGTGFVGSHIVEELLAKGHDVAVITRDRRRMPHYSADVEVIEGDLLDGSAVSRAMEGREACIHNALVWDEEPTELLMRDTQAANVVFGAAAEAGVGRLIYTSSTAVHRPFWAVMSEDSPLRPDGFYGATKAAGEAFLWAFSHQSSMKCSVVRPGPVVELRELGKLPDLTLLYAAKDEQYNNAVVLFEAITNSQ